jgi:hypothetical protein
MYAAALRNYYMRYHARVLRFVHVVVYECDLRVDANVAYTRRDQFCSARMWMLCMLAAYYFVMSSCAE